MTIEKMLDVVHIRKIYKTGKWSYKKLAKRYGVDYTNMYHIIHRKTWKHI